MAIALTTILVPNTTHELDRSTIWQRMWKLRMHMQQRVGMFFPCFFYSVAIHFGC